MVKYGPGRMAGLGTGIALPPAHPATPPRVHPPPTPYMPYVARAGSREVKHAVGLKSVDQLSLYVQISGFKGMTEVYNLFKIGRINNHLYIPGFE